MMIRYPITCPVCQKYEIEQDGYVCDVCGWEADNVQQSDHDYTGGANWVSLNQARANYKECGKSMSQQDEEDETAHWDKWHEEHAAV